MIVLLTWQVWDGVKRPKMFLRTRFANRVSNRSILRIKLLTTSATAANTVVGALVIVVIVVVVVGIGIEGAESVRSTAGCEYI